MKTIAGLGIIFICGTIALTAGCLEQTQKPCQWQVLFDGRTLNGWVQRGGSAKYYAEDIAIVGVSVPNTPNSFLCTRKTYRNFVLELEFLADEALNSGVQIRSNSLPDYKNGAVHGYQVEIDPSLRPYDGKSGKNLLEDGTEVPQGQPRCWTGGIYDEARRGWLYTLSANPAARSAFKNGRWNHLKVEAIGDSIKTWINGVPTADLKDNMTTEGFIGLQVHSVDTPDLKVRWRNIHIKPLP